MYPTSLFPTPSTFLHRFEAGGRVMDSSNLSGPNSGDQWIMWTQWPGSGLQSAEVPRSPEVLVKFTPLQHPKHAQFSTFLKTCATPSVPVNKARTLQLRVFKLAQFRNKL